MNLLCSTDGSPGSMWGSLQPHVPLRPADLFQLCPETAFQKHVFLLPSTHLQTEGGTSAMLGRDTDNRYLPLHPCVQLRGVQLNKCVMEKDPLAETHSKKKEKLKVHFIADDSEQPFYDSLALPTTHQDFKKNHM